MELEHCGDVQDQLFMVTAKGLVRRILHCIDGNELGMTVIQYACNGQPHQNWLFHSEVSAQKSHYNFYDNRFDRFFSRREKSRMANWRSCVWVWVIYALFQCNIVMDLRCSNGHLPTSIRNFDIFIWIIFLRLCVCSFFDLWLQLLLLLFEVFSIYNNNQFIKMYIMNYGLA